MKFEVSSEIVPILPYHRGKITKYHPKMCDVVINTALNRGLKPAMCINCGISEKTFDKYVMEYVDFRDAVEYANLIIQAQAEELIQAGARGEIEKYDFKSVAYILNNNFTSKYGKNEGAKTAITINTINLTPEQLSEKIAQKIEKLKFLGNDYSTYSNDSTVEEDINE